MKAVNRSGEGGLGLYLPSLELRIASVPGLCKAACLPGQGQDLNPDLLIVKVQTDPRNIRISKDQSQLAGEMIS